MVKTLITGGTGYIGSHTVVELISAGHNVTIVDNLVNSDRSVLDRIETITGTRLDLYEFDLEDKTKLDSLFDINSFDAVIHFAGLKAVGESVKQPLRYYRTNLDSTLSLLEVMNTHDVRKLVFSSSATVYGSGTAPFSEDSEVGIGITNPYGQTKYMIEKILEDAAVADPTNDFTILRYFNPVGAHESGLIGEKPNGIPNNLMPYVAQVASGERDTVSVFGNDYDTPDGTGVRDFIHVVDLAQGHLAALGRSSSGCNVFNLGSGKGTSVLELIAAFEKTSGKHIPYNIVPRRAGDIASSYANVSKANRELSWHTVRSIEDACRDTWRWQRSLTQ